MISGFTHCPLLSSKMEEFDSMSESASAILIPVLFTLSNEFPIFFHLKLITSDPLNFHLAKAM